MGESSPLSSAMAIPLSDSPWYTEELTVVEPISLASISCLLGHKSKYKNINKDKKIWRKFEKKKNQEIDWNPNWIRMNLEWIFYIRSRSVDSWTSSKSSSEQCFKSVADPMESSSSSSPPPGAPPAAAAPLSSSGWVTSSSLSSAG